MENEVRKILEKIEEMVRERDQWSQMAPTVSERFAASMVVCHLRALSDYIKDNLSEVSTL